MPEVIFPGPEGRLEGRFVPAPRPRAPVAMPIAWNALSKLERPDPYTIKDVPAMLKRRRKDPWADIDKLKQNLARWSSP